PKWWPPWAGISLPGHNSRKPWLKSKDFASAWKRRARIFSYSSNRPKPGLALPRALMPGHNKQASPASRLNGDQAQPDGVLDQLGTCPGAERLHDLVLVTFGGPG